ncbi:hypothetical protein AB0H76_17025 [Nocardia sp. NPDC050712]|uniref:hypothetical protein n=1 Tax=Nocardia sp. NPDC050712 TaxID=3155518 RepID=UPI0033DA6949
MTRALLVRAETIKLARLLDISDPARLDFLSGLSPEAIRAFRERATDLLFDRDARRMQGVAAAAELVPTAISAKAAERAFGPVLCAAVAGSVKPAQAVAIAKALPAKFLAETAVRLDPRRTAAVIAEVPPRLVAQVAKELFARGDHVTMGRFVGVVPEPSMRAALPEASDADLLRIGFLLEDKSRMDTLLGIVEDRIPGVIRAAYEQGLWAEAIDLLGTVNATNRVKIADVAVGLGTEVLGALLAAVRDLNAWATLIPIAQAQDPAERVRVLEIVAGMADLDGFLAALTPQTPSAVWQSLIEVRAQIPPALAERLAARAEACAHATVADDLRAA